MNIGVIIIMISITVLVMVLVAFTSGLGALNRGSKIKKNNNGKEVV